MRWPHHSCREMHQSCGSSSQRYQLISNTSGWIFSFFSFTAATERAAMSCEHTCGGMSTTTAADARKERRFAYRAAHPPLRADDRLDDVVGAGAKTKRHLVVLLAPVQALLLQSLDNGRAHIKAFHPYHQPQHQRAAQKSMTTDAGTFERTTILVDQARVVQDIDLSNDM